MEFTQMRRQCEVTNDIAYSTTVWDETWDNVRDAGANPVSDTS